MYTFENLCLGIYLIKRIQFVSKFSLSVTGSKICIQPQHTTLDHIHQPSHTYGTVS